MLADSSINSRIIIFDGVLGFADSEHVRLFFQPGNDADNHYHSRNGYYYSDLHGSEVVSRRCDKQTTVQNAGYSTKTIVRAIGGVSCF